MKRKIFPIIDPPSLPCSFVENSTKSMRILNETVLRLALYAAVTTITNTALLQLALQRALALVLTVATSLHSLVIHPQGWRNLQQVTGNCLLTSAQCVAILRQVTFHTVEF